MDLENIFKDIIVQRYENNLIIENNLAYHNWKHTQGVVERALQIEEVLAGGAFLHEKDFALIKCAALGHDLVQDFEWAEAPNKIGKIRVRKTGQNEEKSAEETIKIVKEYKVLTSEEEAAIRAAILITVPAWDEALQTAYQPNLRTVPAYISLCLALADLGVVGMKAEENIVEVGNLLFKEERWLPKTKILNKKQKAILQKEILAWNYKELLFFEGRKIRFQKELVRVANLSWKARGEINKLFSEFDKNIELEKNYCAKCEKMAFEELAKVVGLE
jgi:hypothetical protein